MARPQAEEYALAAVRFAEDNLRAARATLRRIRREAQKTVFLDDDRLNLFDGCCELAATTYRVSVDELLSRKRYQELVMARFAVMAILREDFGWSFERIGDAFRRDHGTVIYGVKQADALRATDPRFREHFEILRERILKTFQKEEE